LVIVLAAIVLAAVITLAVLVARVLMGKVDRCACITRDRAMISQAAGTVSEQEMVRVLMP
jgi:hypothetical protein